MTPTELLEEREKIVHDLISSFNEWLEEFNRVTDYIINNIGESSNG